MSKSRLEAFSDGVIAILITIMVLDLKVPDGADLNALLPLLPVSLGYTLSFIFIGIYWNNHHHLLQIIKHVDGRVLWANLHLLFWLSLIPFATSWMGENSFSTWPTALYGIVLLFSGLAFFILTRSLIAIQGGNEQLAVALGRDHKSKLSVILYAIAIGLAFVNAALSYLLYVFVAMMWLVPDSRIEKILKE